MMRSFRSKPTGWKNDNHRHYLAAKYGTAGKVSDVLKNSWKRKNYMAKEVKYYEPDEEPGKYGKVSFVESVLGTPVASPKIAVFEPKLPKTKEGVQRESAKTSDIMAADIASGKRPNVQDEIQEFELERKRAGLASGDENEFYRREKLARLRTERM
jgi:hypothetical protein